MASNILKNLNDLGSYDFQTIKFSELELRKVYKIGIFRSIETTYGRRILVELLEVGKFIFLPERFKSMGELELENANKRNLGMVFKGQKALENGRKINDIEFLEL